MLASKCLFFFFLPLSASLWRRWGCDWCLGFAWHSGLPHCTRAACQSALGCFIYRWPLGPTQWARVRLCFKLPDHFKTDVLETEVFGRRLFRLSEALKEQQLAELLDSVVIYHGKQRKRMDGRMVEFCLAFSVKCLIFFLQNQHSWRLR